MFYSWPWQCFIRGVLRLGCKFGMLGRHRRFHYSAFVYAGMNEWLRLAVWQEPRMGKWGRHSGARNGVLMHRIELSWFFQLHVIRASATFLPSRASQCNGSPHKVWSGLVWNFGFRHGECTRVNTWVNFVCGLQHLSRYLYQCMTWLSCSIFQSLVVKHRCEW